FGPTLVHRTWVKGSGKALWGLEPDSLRGKLPPFLPDVPEVREDFADYLGEIQALDAGIGVLLDRLAAVGELDRTLIVISGDHGAPGFPQGKCNLYDFGVGVPLVMRAPGSPGGRVVEDLVSLVDLCPTFLETGGVRPPADLDGRSLLSLLRSGDSGRTPAGRKWVLCGRERHVGAARAGNLPYPQRSLRADRYLYIRNFRPERWPLGDPGAVTESTAPGAALLEQNTRVAFADMDASPTKAWLVAHRRDPACQSFYQLAFGRRPAEELYNLLKDPHQLTNVAADSAYAATRRRLEQQLLAVLRTAGDPRVTGDGDTFERPPFTDP
ncbi:MAG: sulfatase, partial [Armatimonadetes bacterium]|nr:sulfatase [Armatimonadota bacterium]